MRFLIRITQQDIIKEERNKKSFLELCALKMAYSV